MSRKRANRTHRGRAAAEPRKFPKAVHECDHTDGGWDVKTEVLNAWHSPSGNTAADAPDRELVGHLLCVRWIICTECGERFRFCNVAVGGNAFLAPQAGQGALELFTRVEPDARIIVPDARGGSRIIKPN